MKKTLALASIKTAIVLALALAGPATAQTTEPQKGGTATDGKGPRAQFESLLTPQERDQFREKMRSAKTREERQEIQKQMRGTAEQRAKEKGITLPRRAEGHSPRGEGAVKDAQRPQLFTSEERAQHRDKLRAAKTPEERQALRRALRVESEKRAKEKGITLPQRPRRDDIPKNAPPAPKS